MRGHQPPQISRHGVEGAGDITELPRPVRPHCRIELSSGEDPRLAPQILQGTGDSPGDENRDRNRERCRAHGRNQEIAADALNGVIHIVKRQRHRATAPAPPGWARRRRGNPCRGSRCAAELPDSVPRAAITSGREHGYPSSAGRRPVGPSRRQPRPSPARRSGAQPVDERIDVLDPPSGFQRRRLPPPRAEPEPLAGRRADRRRAGGRRRRSRPRAPPPRQRRGQPGKSEAGTDGTGQELRRRRARPRSSRPGLAGGDSSRRTGRGSGHRPQYRSAVSPSRASIS